MTVFDLNRAAPDQRLRHLPMGYFSMVMGLAGMTLAAQKAEAVLGAATGLPALFAALAAATFAALAVLHALKALRHWPDVRAEFEHPVKLHFFPTFSISLLLLSAVAGSWSPEAALALLAVGALLHLGFTLAVLHFWFTREHFQTIHLNPAWFIPIVGNVLVPIAAVPLGFAEAGWFFFSIGIAFWLPLFALVLNRVMFHAPLPDRLAPTLFILIAPPAVGFLAWVRLTGDIDPAARILYHFALFMTLFLATQAPRLARLRFAMSWWAYSFPLAAVTTATWTMAERVGGPAFETLAAALSLALVVAVCALAWRTGLAVARGEVCQPE